MPKKILPHKFIKTLAEELGIKPGTLRQRILREDKETIKLVNGRLRKEHKDTTKVLQEYREMLDIYSKKSL